jgi:hypothetical protein
MKITNEIARIHVGNLEEDPKNPVMELIFNTGEVS